MNRNQEIAGIILQQLGTSQGKIRAMVSGQCLAIENGLQINFKGSRKANKVQIVLNGKDLYDVTFLKYSPKTYDCKIVTEHNDVFADMLKGIWYSETGLYLSL